jgi:hypothetical protein
MSIKFTYGKRHFIIIDKDYLIERFDTLKVLFQDFPDLTTIHLCKDEYLFFAETVYPDALLNGKVLTFEKALKRSRGLQHMLKWGDKQLFDVCKKLDFNDVRITQALKKDSDFIFSSKYFEYILRMLDIINRLPEAKKYKHLERGQTTVWYYFMENKRKELTTVNVGSSSLFGVKCTFMRFLGYSDEWINFLVREKMDKYIHSGEKPLADLPSYEMYKPIVFDDLLSKFFLPEG